MNPKDSEFVDTTHLEDNARISPTGDHERGPPNRINDLNYSDWMKFQKSFFRHPSDQTIVAETIYFFTKEQYDDGNLSETLLIGFDNVDPDEFETDRIIDTYQADSVEETVEILTDCRPASYDFVLIDFRDIIDSEEAVDRFFDSYVDEFWATLRETLVDERFAGVFAEYPSTDGGGFPIPWAIAGSCRNHVRLKDEKIGLVEQHNDLFYKLFVQAVGDHREPTWLTPERLQVANIQTGPRVPLWLIPKPPARDNDEILHPAKYPETLVEEFIKIFTSEGDTVFDPMVGTGSTVLAAIRNERDGYGVDLKQKYVDIAQERADNEYRMTLSGEVQPQADNTIVRGDATALDAIGPLEDTAFDYVVTSPPYWSMLNNPGSENQQERREQDLPLKYSESDADLGNIEEYEDFLDMLEQVYAQVSSHLTPDGHLTVIVKNIKRNHISYPLAWDLVDRLCGPTGEYEYFGTTFWCQDDIGLKPFAVGTHWVSNTLHNYCLHFSKN